MVKKKISSTISKCETSAPDTFLIDKWKNELEVQGKSSLQRVRDWLLAKAIKYINYLLRIIPKLVLSHSHANQTNALHRFGT